MSKQLFYVGQTVICINDDFDWSRKRYQSSVIVYPIFGSRYVVRSYVCGGSHPAIVLQEIHNPDVIYIHGGIREAGFWQGRFVGAPPPIENKTVVKKEKEMV